jgi:hypothetical protein
VSGSGSGGWVGAVDGQNEGREGHAHSRDTIRTVIAIVTVVVVVAAAAEEG